MPRWRYKRLALGLGTLGLTACGGNPSLPTRQIDRPFTLPSDTKEIALGAGISVTHDTTNPSSVTHVYPVGPWRAPINDEWTYELLTAVSHQLHHDEVDTTGVLFGAQNIGYSSDAGFFAQPVLSLYWKHLLGPNIALQHRLEGVYSFTVSEPNLDGWSVTYTIAPLFQLDDSKSISPQVGLGLERRFPAPLAGFFSLAALPNTANVVVPLGWEFLWRLSRGWETELSYSYRGIGYANGYHGHFGTAELIRYW